MQQLGLDISDSSGSPNSTGDMKGTESKSSDDLSQAVISVPEKEANDAEELKEFEPAAKRPAPAFEDTSVELKPTEENLKSTDELPTKDGTPTQSPKAE